MKSPCLKCERSGCGEYHDRCPEYQKFKIEQARIIKKKHEESEIIGAIAVHVHTMRTKNNPHKVTKSPKK